ncbi:hypothetical protein K503DRAFT_870315 [Rhizopogon vinicolor AM-OR11-026]|uniref:Uncharacterized protein n=1 Tax=Rhizopogon vinicolor AM-OR11-026 TaxID=1314800 RepID=A0A1B7MHQ0_9AGAM|nr:hypothetical protein K503DRAFT_870315 [Rhizopogon vinicolor AM-OR11-026]
MVGDQDQIQQPSSTMHDIPSTPSQDVVNVSYYYGFDRKPAHLLHTAAACAAGLASGALVLISPEAAERLGKVPQRP